jgi:hypothetical protein
MFVILCSLFSVLCSLAVYHAIMARRLPGASFLILFTEQSFPSSAARLLQRLSARSIQPDSMVERKTFVLKFFVNRRSHA